jgi:predicted O-methyltransferase YrrM
MVIEKRFSFCSKAVYSYHSHIKHIINKLFRSYISPSLSTFSRFNFTIDARRAIRTLLYREIPDYIEEEYNHISRILSEREKTIKLRYPKNFEMEKVSTFFIYAFIRLYKPNNVVETGVANGVSTFFILSALKKNKKGKLYSIDINSNVGSLVTNDLMPYWKLIILYRANRNNIEKVLMQAQPIDIFIHDSNHMYYYQKLEYYSAFKYIKKGGYIMTDDADASYAFVDFCNNHRLTPTFIYDMRKVFGVTKLKT